MGWVIGIGIAVVLSFIFAYSLCKVSGDSNRVAERDHEEIMAHRSTILSDLEKESIEKLSKDIVNMGISE